MNKETNLTPTTFENVLQMGKSQDKENHIVALNIIENIDFKDNLSYILLLKKNSNIDGESWKEYSPKVTESLDKLGIPYSKSPTYKQMLQILVEQKAPVEDLNFFCTMFSKELTTSVKNLGYDYIDDLDITIKINHNGKTVCVNKTESAGKK